MDAGPGTDLGALGWFVGVWVVMMAAMMFPSVAPMVAIYARMARRRGGRIAPLLFVGRLPADLDGGRPRRLRRSSSSGARCRRRLRGTAPAAGWPVASLLLAAGTSSRR